MSVYVDVALPWPTSARWPYKKAAHLIADALAELHEFALRIGLKRAWFQNHEFLPHYDITTGKRRLAIETGAIALERKEFVARFRTARAVVMAAREAAAKEPTNA